MGMGAQVCMLPASEVVARSMAPVRGHPTHGVAWRVARGDGNGAMSGGVVFDEVRGEEHVSEDDGGDEGEDGGHAFGVAGFLGGGGEEDAVEEVTGDAREDAGGGVFVGEEVDAVGDFADAQDAEDAGVFAVVDAHGVLEGFWREDFGESDGDGGESEDAAGGAVGFGGGLTAAVPGQEHGVLLVGFAGGAVGPPAEGAGCAA